MLPIVASRYGVGHVGLVMGAFNLGAFAAPLAGNLAVRYRAYRLLTIVCAAVSAVSLWLFALASPWQQPLLALINGARFAAAVTIASLLVVERQPKAAWNRRLGWLETALSIGQGSMLILAAFLSGLHARPALAAAAIVPATHRLQSAGHVGEWGPAGPSRVHQSHRHSLSGMRATLRGEFGWLLAAWMPAYAGAAILFALYPVLFRNAFRIAPHVSALTFAVIVFASLPLFVLVGRVSQRRGPAVTMAGALAARVILLTVLALLAALEHVPAVLPLAAFAGIMFAWSYLSVASPGLTAQLAPGDEGDAQGALNAGSGLAGLAGSVIGGFAAARWGYPTALGIGAGAVAVGLVIFAAKVMRHRSIANPS